MALSSIKEISLAYRYRPQASPSKSCSPKRVFSSSQSKLLRALDSVELYSGPQENGSLKENVSEGRKDDDPFGSAWPPPRKERLQELDGGLVTTSVVGELHVTPSFSSKSLVPNQSATALKPHTGRTHGLAPVSPINGKPFAGTSREKVSTFLARSPFNLPTYSYKDYKPAPARVYVRHADEAEELISALSGPLGFDLEWRVIFRRNAPERPVATVQVSDQRMILVIQVTAMRGFPKKLKDVLEDPKIPKLGVNILNDGIKLARDYGVRPQGLVELGGLARQADPDYVERYFKYAELKPVVKTTKSPSASSAVSGTEPEPEPKMRKPGFMISLARITAMYTECKLLKGPVRTSNWEALPLSDTQLEYAANDAHCALQVYTKLMAMAEKNDIKLDPSRYTQGVKYFYGSKPKAAIPASNAAQRSRSGSSEDSSTRPPSETSSHQSSEPRPPSSAQDESSSAGKPKTLQASRPFVRKSVAKPTSSNGTVRQRPQHIRAYNFWHLKRLPIDDIRRQLRSPENPLKLGTVIGYVVGALQADPTLQFCYDRLVDLLKMEEASWNRHKEWFEGLDEQVYRNMNKGI